MKKYDLVKLIKLKNEYKLKNLYINLYGIIVETDNNFSKVLFFNEQNHGDYAVVKTENKDLELQKEQFPLKYLNEFKKTLENENIFKNDKLKILPVKIYDMVELITENEKYASQGIHKGDTGCIMEDYAVKDYVLVDFSGIDQNGNYYGDCICVKIKDLKVINN